MANVTTHIVMGYIIVMGLIQFFVLLLHFNITILLISRLKA